MQTRQNNRLIHDALKSRRVTSVCMYVCVYVGVCVWGACMKGCVYGYALRRALMYGAEIWHGGRAGPTRFKSIYSKWPDQRSKVIQISSCYRPPNLVGRGPWPKKNAMLGSKVIQGSTGVNHGSIAQECRMATKFGRKNPWPKSSALVGLTVM